MTVMLRKFLLRITYLQGGNGSEVKEYGRDPQDARKRVAEKNNVPVSRVEVVGEIPE